jgi:hypothetical protein
MSIAHGRSAVRLILAAHCVVIMNLLESSGMKGRWPAETNEVSKY